MPLAVRVGLVVLGAVTTVYGVASLTGGWLGTPPWWERVAFPVCAGECINAVPASAAQIRELNDLYASSPDYDWAREPRPGREWISGAVVAAGLALVAVGAWPRRRAGVAR